MYKAAVTQEVLHTLLRHAKTKNYVEGKLTLTFDNIYQKNHFKKFYKRRFEVLASELFGKEIKVEVEGEK